MNPYAQTIRNTLTTASRRWSYRVRLKRFAYTIWLLALILLGLYGLCSLVVVPHEFLRVCILLTLAAIVGGAFWISLTPRCSLTEIAQRYEGHFPRFKGRLNLCAEILSHSHMQEAWPEFATHALRRSAHHLSRYSVEQVLPLYKTWRLLFSGLALLVLVTGLYLFGPNPKPAQQLALAWETRGGRGYKLVLSQPQVSIVRGRAVTLTAYLIPITSRYQIPDEVFLVLRTPNGAERFPMLRTDEIWTVEIPNIETSCDYYVEGNRVRSSYGFISVVDPLELLETEIRILPPSYLDRGGERLNEFASLTVIAGGELQFRFQWSEPPRSAEIYFQPDSAEESVSLPLILNRKGEGQGNYRPVKSGVYRLRAISQAGVPFEWASHVLTVYPDQLPQWENLRGFPTQNRRARTTDQLWIRGTVKDDLALHDIYLEWRLNEGPAKKVRLAELEEGATQVSIDQVFSLHNRGRIGDRLYFRLVASDNRPLTLPEHSRTRYPQRGWLEIILDDSSSPLNEQEALASELEIHASLLELQKLLLAQAQQSDPLLQALKRNPLTLQEHPERLRGLFEKLEDSLNLIEQLRSRIDPIFGFAKMRDSLKGLQDHFTRLQQSLQLLVAEPDRSDALDLLKELTPTYSQCIKLLEGLLQENQQVSRRRVLAAQLENLGQAAAALAEQAPRTPDSPPPQLPALLTAWNALWNDHHLKEPIQLTRNQHLFSLGKTLNDLLPELQQIHLDLEQALAQQKEHFFKAAKTRFHENLPPWEKHFEEGDFLARVLRQPSLDRSPLNEAQKQLRVGDTLGALQALAKWNFTLKESTQNLRLTLEKLDEPREQGQILIRLQEEVLSELDNQTRERTWQQLPLSTQQRLLEYQKTVAEIQIQLGLKGDRAWAVIEILNKGDVPQARMALSENLTLLRMNVPSLASQEQRILRVQEEIAILRKESDQYGKTLEVLKRDAAKANPDDLADRIQQRQLLQGLALRVSLQHERLQQLWVPLKIRPRWEKIQKALHLFCNDLTEGLYADSVKSLSWLRKELQAWDTEQQQGKTLDTEIEEAAQKLAELVEKHKRVPLPKIVEILGEYQRISQGWSSLERGATVWYFQEQLLRAEKELAENPRNLTSLNEAVKTLRLLSNLCQYRLEPVVYLEHWSRILAQINQGNAKKVAPKWIEEWRLFRVGVGRYTLWKKILDQTEGWLRGQEKWNPPWRDDLKKWRASFTGYEEIPLDPETALGLFGEILSQTTPVEAELLLSLSESLPLKESDLQALRGACRKLAEVAQNPDPAALKIGLAQINEKYELACQNWEKILEKNRPRAGFPTPFWLNQTEQIIQEIDELQQQISQAQQLWQRDRACQRLEDDPSPTQRPVLEILQKWQRLTERVAGIAQTLQAFDSGLADQTKQLAQGLQIAWQCTQQTQDEQSRSVRMGLLKKWPQLIEKFPAQPEAKLPASVEALGESLWTIQTKILACQKAHQEKKAAAAAVLWREVESGAYRSSSLVGSGGE
jgi:hypothetical protein